MDILFAARNSVLQNLVDHPNMRDFGFQTIRCAMLQSPSNKVLAWCGLFLWITESEIKTDLDQLDSLEII